MTFTPARILIVEDDGRILEEAAAALRSEGYEPALARTLAVAHARLSEGVDLVLLDLGLPDGDGLELCRELSRTKPELPVVVVTARDSVEARVKGLDAGADDYVGKPYHPSELIARVRSVLRRSARNAPSDAPRVGELWADAEKIEAGRGEQRFHLKPREFQLLLFLLRNPGRPWTRDQLLDRVWGRDFDGDERTVDVHVRQLRAQIEETPKIPQYLRTEWGVGYRLEAPE